jgi:uncharacterized membrane protein YedE/YeeE
MKPSQYALLLIAGAVFGCGLAVSGMSDPTRVIGFLDVTGSWDPTLAFVMGGAVGSYSLGLLLWQRRSGGKAWFGKTLPTKNPDTIELRPLVGAAIFGVGWGLAGFCPGPALANLGALHTEALVFVPAMVVGMLITRFAFREI